MVPEPPTAVSAESLAQRLGREFGSLVVIQPPFRGETTVVLTDPERVVEVSRFGRLTLGFDFLLDITSVDQYGEDPRWVLVYEWYGLDHRAHLRLKTHVSEEKSCLPSVSGEWPTANWHEREIYDMMGIRFQGHPDLRRILMWEGYPYHPLRKDFPLAGKPTDLPEIAFTQPAPEEGGPFVTVAGARDTATREPRARLPQEEGG